MYVINKSLLLMAAITASAQAVASDGTELIAGGVLDSFRPVSGWHVVGDVAAVDGETRLVTGPLGNGDRPYLVNSLEKSRVPYLFTTADYDDVEVSLEFMIPRGSNAGVYLMGRYEVQILDSFGKSEVTHGDLGGVYQRWRDKQAAIRAGLPQGYEGVAPLVNAAEPPGVWQAMRIRFRAPRFDASGTKIENAKFVTVHVNGRLVQRDVEVTGPTRAAPRRGEASTGPIAIQGDHGPIAIRSFVVEPLVD